MEHPGADASAWALSATLRMLVAGAAVFALLKVVGHFRARELSETARRFLADEAHRQRWRRWIFVLAGGGFVLLRWLVEWQRDAVANGPQGNAWLLLAFLLGVVAYSGYQIAWAVRERAWRVG
jgi:hypothetical protein